MTKLKTQPTAMPTRKLLAVAVATFLVQGTVGVLEMFVPGIGGALPAQEWIMLLAPLMAGYLVKDRA
ncbi:MAG: hypothetical protein AAFN94_00885 [Pseudomonadota bacterium]